MNTTKPRESIHTECGLSTSPSGDDESFPTDADKEFLRAASNEIFNAVRTGVSTVPSAGMLASVGIKNELTRILGKLSEKWSESWNYRVRFVHALLMGLRTEQLVISSADDAKALREMFRVGIPAQVIEYYVYTGELLDLADFYRDDEGNLPFSRDTFEQFAMEDQRMRVFQLYCYDINKVIELIDGGIDPSDHMNLPMDVRIEFSGANGYLYTMERNDFSFDHMGTVVDDMILREQGNYGIMVT